MTGCSAQQSTPPAETILRRSTSESGPSGWEQSEHAETSRFRLHPAWFFKTGGLASQNGLAISIAQ
jgi:hypothetical protein